VIRALRRHLGRAGATPTCHDRPVPALALLAHGAGSCPETARRLLGPAVPPGVEIRAVDSRGSIDDVVARIAEAARDGEVALVGGISLGAHAAALWSARGGIARSLLLAMPAWTGDAEQVAALTASTADDIEAFGIERVLARVAGVAADDDWVLDELRRGWRTYDDVRLAATLRSAAASPGPTPDELARITAPTAVVALADDPLHPAAVARRWTDVLPRAALGVVGRHEPAHDRGALGRVGRTLLDSLERP
jgi:pimeloyl-ACP methyl ester carboxylesterase